MRVSLDNVTSRLSSEFDGRVALPVIETAVYQAYRDLDGSGCDPAPALPELVERIARQRLLTISGPTPVEA
jgi:hypothetical protein